MLIARVGRGPATSVSEGDIDPSPSPLARPDHVLLGEIGANLAIGAVGCSVGARVQDEWAAPIVLLGVLGVTSLVLAVIAVITAAQWALLALAIVLVTLWLGATLRHAFTPPRPIAVP